MKATGFLNIDDYKDVINLELDESFAQNVIEGYNQAKKDYIIDNEVVELTIGTKVCKMSCILTMLRTEGNKKKATLFMLSSCEDVGLIKNMSLYSLKTLCGIPDVDQYVIIVPESWIDDTTMLSDRAQQMLILHEIGHVFMGVGIHENIIVDSILEPVITKMRLAQNKIDLSESIPDVFAVKLLKANRYDIEEVFDYLEEVVKNCNKLPDSRKEMSLRDLGLRRWACNTFSLRFGTFREYQYTTGEIIPI